jgi:tryptophan synthase alpha chain
MAAAGADAIEVGIPFSDPVMDGPVIQQASEIALAAGATPVGLLDELASADVGVPLAVMTYANLVYRFGWQRFAEALVKCGASAAIIPDIPLEEAGDWCTAADSVGVETVMLAAPTGSDDRLERIIERSRGFVYAVGLLGVTGVRDSLADTSRQIAARLKALTDKPVLVGVGVGTPDQAAQVCEVADGVVVGSAIVRCALETGSPEAVGDLVGEFRAAIS